MTSTEPYIWLTGDKGLLGTQIGLELSKQGMFFIGTDIDVDITSLEAVREFMEIRPFNWIINCAAYTAVDQAEENHDQAFLINQKGIENLAIISKEKHIPIIHFSTDYVFDGKSRIPYKETDNPSPESVYGSSKLAGEHSLIENTNLYFILRISWLYGLFGSNFVLTMLKLMKEKNSLNVISDQIGAPTYASKLAQNIVSLIKNPNSAYGIYHYSDSGQISWYNFACTIQKLGFEHKLIDNCATILPVDGSTYPTQAKRPDFSCFNTEKVISGLNFTVKHWEENLRDFFKEYSTL